MRIFKCSGCNNIVIMIKEGTCIPKCCGDDMIELKVNTIDAAVEKHVPVVDEQDGIVKVTCGEVIHPMEEKHYIEFMIIETNKGYQIKYLNPGDKPICEFILSHDERFVSAYAYCNLHGLWSNS